MRLIRCVVCELPGAAARRVRCVKECGAWLCRSGKTCKAMHAQACPHRFHKTPLE